MLANDQWKSKHKNMMLQWSLQSIRNVNSKNSDGGGKNLLWKISLAHNLADIYFMTWKGLFYLILTSICAVDHFWRIHLIENQYLLSPLFTILHKYLVVNVFGMRSQCNLQVFIQIIKYQHNTEDVNIIILLKITEITISLKYLVQSEIY